MKHIRTLMDEVAQHIEIDEGRMKDIFTMDQEGQSVKEIAKRLKLPLGTVKKILGEETDLQEFSDSQLDVLARQYAGLKGRTISIDQANKLRQIFNRIPDRSLDALRRKKIPFLSGLALSRMVQKGMPVKEEKECPPGQYYCKESGMCKPNSMKQEAFAVQVTKKDGGKFIHGSYKSKEEAEKFVKWYKTGDLRTTKKIEVVKEMAKDDAYAIGMAQAKKSMKDEPPLEKKTITKGHEIAKKILAKEARWQIEGQLSYRNISGSDGFHMVINASSEQDAENKAYKELDKARDRKKIGPGGGGSLEDVDIENIERTSDKLQAPSTFRVSEFDPSEVKEGKAPFRLSYDDRYGKHAGFEDAKTLADLQNKAANLRKRGFVINKMGRNTSPVKEENLKEAPDPTTYGPDKVAKAMAIAVKSDGQYSKAVREIEKIGKDLSKVSTIARALKTANEGLNERGGANTSTRQGSFARSRKPKYRFGYRVAEKDPSIKEGFFNTKTFAQMVEDIKEKENDDKEKSLKIKLDKEKDQDALEKQLVAAQGKINILQQKLENEKNKVVKPEPNKETGEVPLTVGIAHKYLKDKQEKEVKKESMDNYPTSDIQKKKQDIAKDPKGGEKKPVHLGARMTYESIKGLKNKADKTGMPYSILKKVYDRGMAAWRGGHRPGTTQQQWAFARVNSFVTKSSGTWGGADKDLAKQVRGK